MRRRDWILLAVILVLLGFSLWIDLANPMIAFWRPIPEVDDPVRRSELEVAIRSTTLRLGLDLQGGMQVILEGQGPPDLVNRDNMEVAQAIISSRIDDMGVFEPVVQVQGDSRLVVEMPGVFDRQQALSAMQGTGFLEFVDTYGAYLPPGTPVSTTYGLSEDEIAAITGTTVYRTVVTGQDLLLQSIRPAREGLAGSPAVELAFNPAGTAKFAEWTTAHAKQPLAIVLDKRVISAPEVREPITNGKAVISGGSIDWEEAVQIARLLKYGALPVPLVVVENRTVGPTLGQDSVSKSVVAGVIGLGTVLLFMTLYYRLPGVLAGLALCVYTALIFAIYCLIPVTLTLPGIAGLLLSIGMAVDANILIFERMKEELRAGKSLRASIEAGFDRAWTSIWDSNLSTLLTCAILLAFGLSLGASIVRGFAITLAVGVVVSMFSAITVTRTFLRTLYHLAGAWLERHSRLLLGVSADGGS